MLWINSKGTLSTDQQQFSSLLHAPPYRPYTKPVIIVSRFYENVDSSTPRHSENLGGRSAAMAGSSTLHHPSTSEPDMEMDTHDTVINEDDLPPKTGSKNDCDVLAGYQGSSSTPNHLSVYSLKEAQKVGNSPITLGVSAGGKSMGNESKEKEKISDQSGSSYLFQNKLDEIDRELRKFEVVTDGIRDEKGEVSELGSMRGKMAH